MLSTNFHRRGIQQLEVCTRVSSGYHDVINRAGRIVIGAAALVQQGADHAVLCCLCALLQAPLACSTA